MKGMRIIKREWTLNYTFTKLSFLLLIVVKWNSFSHLIFLNWLKHSPEKILYYSHRKGRRFYHSQDTWGRAAAKGILSSHNLAKGSYLTMLVQGTVTPLTFQSSNQQFRDISLLEWLGNESS